MGLSGPLIIISITLKRPTCVHHHRNRKTNMLFHIFPITIEIVNKHVFSIPTCSSLDALQPTLNRIARYRLECPHEDKVCVGRGESAGGVGVSAAAGCASRPAPSAVSAGGKCRVGRRQVPCRPAPSAVAAGARYTVSAAEGLCRTAAL